MSELITIKQKLAAAALAMLGAATLSGCGSEAADYEGQGNDFIVRGVVSDSEDDGLVQTHEDQTVVLRSSGEASEWFGDKEGQGFLHDEYDFLQAYSKEPGRWFNCGKDIYVGKVYDADRKQIEPEALEPGMLVEIKGRIRDSRYYQSTGKSGYCTEESLAVYDSITIIDGRPQ